MSVLFPVLSLVRKHKQKPLAVQMTVRPYETLPILQTRISPLPPAFIGGEGIATHKGQVCQPINEVLRLALLPLAAISPRRLGGRSAKILVYYLSLFVMAIHAGSKGHRLLRETPYSLVERLTAKNSNRLPVAVRRPAIQG